jgi:hypothetical protein
MQLAPFGEHDGEVTVPHPPSMHVRPAQHAELEAQATPAGEHAGGAASGGAYVSGTNVSGAPLSTPGGSTPRGVRAPQAATAARSGTAASPFRTLRMGRA